MEGMEVETSLDVLSRAASLIETETETDIIKARPVESKCCAISISRYRVNTLNGMLSWLN